MNKGGVETTVPRRGAIRYYVRNAKLCTLLYMKLYTIVYAILYYIVLYRTILYYMLYR